MTGAGFFGSNFDASLCAGGIMFAKVNSGIITLVYFFTKTVHTAERVLGDPSQITSIDVHGCLMLVIRAWIFGFSALLPQ
jgi:hypothetical protein